jgi:hypothetical protein
MFTKGAKVNVGGLVASTLDITDEDFNNGNYVFQGNSNAQVINMGKIKAAEGGYVALLGKDVANEGVIVAQAGTVSLNGAKKATLNFNGDSLVNVSLDEGALGALVSNKKAIIADGGQVILTAKAADDILGSQVNNTGLVQARTLAELNGAPAKKGKITLYAYGGTANVAGKLDASAPKGGDGGFIETSGDKVKIASSAKITTKAAQGQTGTWLIDPTDFTVAASGGDITGEELGTKLGLNNVVIATSGVSIIDKGQPGDIYINDVVSWSNNELTLSADHSIYINKNLVISNDGKLYLKYNQAGATGDQAGDYNILTKASFSGVVVSGGTDGKGYTEGVAGAGGLSKKSDLDTGEYASITFTNTSAITGYLKMNDGVNDYEYKLVHTLDQLKAINGTTGNYALANDLDLSGQTFTNSVIANSNGSTITGLGHAIKNLNVTSASGNYSGLIGRNQAGTVRDLGLIDTTISAAAYTGALVGYANGGRISHVYSENGKITTTGGNVGGLVGYTNTNTRIDNCFATGTIDAAGTNIGGLVGYGKTATTIIENSHASGSVTSQDGTLIGGLVGRMEGPLSNAWANVAVKGVNTIGGLIGTFQGTSVTNSFALGSVTGRNLLGGLIAFSNVTNTTISNSYAKGNIFVTGLATAPGEAEYYGGLIGRTEANQNISYVHATGNIAYVPGMINPDWRSFYVGGLIGSLWDNSSVSYAYARGNVFSADTETTVNSLGTFRGGLIGQSRDNIKIDHSYAEGDVYGPFDVGGLVGFMNYGTISNSYSNGLVANSQVGRTESGGFVGRFGAGDSTITNSYWDAEKSGHTEGFGVKDDVGGLSGSPTGLSGTEATLIGTYASQGKEAGDAAVAAENQRIAADKAAADAAQAAATAAAIGSNQVTAATQSTTTLSGAGAGSVNLASLDLTTVNLANAFTVSADLGGGSSSGASNAGLTGSSNPFAANLGQVTVDGSSYSLGSNNSEEERK